ncbi:MAG: hypothetical protein FWG94_01920 [Oscillospiraceae bacterium]|nr:hypothetical protein [Oscillospiraceae bacterium]
MKTNNNVTVSLGKPITAPVLVPVINEPPPTRCINRPFNVKGEWHKVTAMSFGTPHGAVFVDDVDAVDVPSLGYALGNYVLFPKGASIVFIEVLDKESVKARLWQRGEGEIPFTLEAACVAGTAAMMLQKVLHNETAVHMGGNAFRVNWTRGDGEVSLSGPAGVLGVNDVSLPKPPNGDMSA